MTTAMTKRAMIDALAKEHRALLLLVQTLAREDFERPSVVGDWSVKDLFGHLAYWDQEAAIAIGQVASDQRPLMMLDKDDETVNAREVDGRRAQPLMRVMDEYRRNHLRLAAALERTAEAGLWRTFAHKSADGKDANAGWIAGGIIEHYQEHHAALSRALNR